MDSSNGSSYPDASPGSDTASCAAWISTPSTSTGLGVSCPDDGHRSRRAYSFWLAPPDMLDLMTAAGSSDTERVAVLIRMRVDLRDALRRRMAGERASINHYLEQLVHRDLDEKHRLPFVPVSTPTFASKGKNGTGRPTKGARSPVFLRVVPELRQQIHQRADALQLTVNDYLESLVSYDISAAATGEAMDLHETA